MRTRKLLVSVSVVLLGAGLLGLAAGSPVAAVPVSPRLGWAWTGSPEAPPPAPDRARQLRKAKEALDGSWAVGFLASPASRRELAEAGAGFQHGPPAGAPVSDTERALAHAVHRVHESAVGSAVMALILSSVLVLAGVLGLLRLKMRGWTWLSVSLLAMASAPLVPVGFDVNPLLVAMPALIALLGAVGQLLGTNLLPDSNAGIVARLEERLRGVAPGARGRWVALRVVGGGALSFVAVVATVLSYWYGPGTYYVAYVGVLGGGLVIAGTAVIAWLRVAVPSANR